MRKRERHGYGQHDDPTYSKYQAMKQRCSNPKHRSYPNYGGRGITVCAEWRDSFKAFLEYMGPCPSPTSTIDRIDSSEGYKPGNCRWLDKSKQSANTRRCVPVEIDGVQYSTISEAALAYGLPRTTVIRRIRSYGWDVEKALKTPVDTTKRKLTK